jgi:hypothetical protein
MFVTAEEEKVTEWALHKKAKIPLTAVSGWFRSCLQRESGRLDESYPRQWVDGSDPFYKAGRIL